MYLSRLLLNPRSRDVRRDLSNVHDMHRRVLTAFPDQEIATGARREYQTLYRVEIGATGAVSVLVQSALHPDWARLPEDYLVRSFEPNPATTELQPLLDRLRPSQRMRFRLRANATKRLRGTDAARGKRIEIVGDEPLLSWLNRKAVKAGFALETRPASDDEPLTARLRVNVTQEAKARGRRSGSSLTFGSTLFDGELTVTEPTLFANALRVGFGSGKAYGFGLLSVAPA